MKPARAIGIVIVTAGLLPFAASALVGHFLSISPFRHEPLHAFFEISGAFMAIAVAMLLALRLQRAEYAHLSWPLTALICMGVLDALHGASEFGAAWSWSRHLSTLCGGLLFGLVWVPARWTRGARRHIALLTGAALASASAVTILVAPHALPPPWTPTGYTFAADLVNAVGGIGFLLSAIYFLRRYQRAPAADDLVFAAHCLMFTAAAFAFAFSNVWQPGWWLWHGFRLLAYIIIVTAAFRFVRQMQRTIQQHNRELEQKVEHRTAELAAKNALLAAEVEERRQVEEALRRSEAKLQEMNDALEVRVHERTAELREMISHLDAFSYSLVHDLRAPLRAMNAFAKILDEEYRERLDERAARYLSRIGNAASRMDLLIQDVLSYSRLSREEIKFEDVDLHMLLNDIVHQYPDLADHAPNIVVDCAGTRVFGSTAFLTQTFSNLLRNAVKFVPKGTPPKVSVWSEESPEHIVVSVRDNGIGIPPEKHEQIFGVFQRLHGEDVYPGTGIGLAIVKRSVERMKGRIRLESEPGKGSTFRVDLPKRERLA